MSANNALQLTSIDFDGIKNDLKAFLSNQTELGDYNYESSTMQIMLNLLAYNTYKNSFYLNMVGNEMFLDSAQIRNNVVSRAKMLGYTPRSAQGPTATVKLTITPGDTPDNITIPADTQFTTTVDGVNYVYVNPAAAVINANASGVYSTNLKITEGSPFTYRFTVDSGTPIRYVIPNENVDTRSLSIRVQSSSSNTSQTTWLPAADMTAVAGNTYAYFLDENDDGRYEIKFGDNVVGRGISDGNIVVASYRICNGTATQSANVFTTSATIDGYNNITVQAVEVASGGAQQESVASIKFNAPRDYQAQNRAVTTGDYEVLIRNNFSDIGAVSVWGGQDNDPPTFGKAFIAVKPNTGFFISENRKEDIDKFLSNKSVMSTTPEIVDPTYKFIVPTVTVKYNPNLTSSTAGAIVNTISNRVVQYELSDLVTFGKEYASSELIKNIYTANESISSIEIDLRMMKNFIPVTTSITTYTIPFNDPLLNTTGGAAAPGRGLTVSSSRFTYENQDQSFLDDDGFGNVRIYYINESGARVYTNRTAGHVFYDTGLITLDQVLITAYNGAALEVYVVPANESLVSLRNQILAITQAKISLYDTKEKRITSSTSNVSTQGSNATVVGSGVISTVF
tara:strand:- start:522 stop:2393 length:1872 start_codon:yes stop_codon:yes gene_type:complete